MIENEKKERLKLFVVGESSADPEKWSGEGAWALVIAHNAGEAASMARDAFGTVVEIPFDKPKKLLFESSKIVCD